MDRGIDGGATHNGSGQWDGFIGRVTAPHGSANPTQTLVFQAIGGGKEQDGLFGLAEISVDGPEQSDAFVVVGSTRTVGTPATGSFTYPFTVFPLPLNNAASTYCLGTVSGFQVSSSGALTLFASRELGGLDDPTQNHYAMIMARDVWVGHGPVQWAAATETIYVVGSTSDAWLFSLGKPVIFQGPDATLSGTDGFLFAIPSEPYLNTIYGTFVGGPGDDGLTGVASWSEYPDLVSVVGFAAGAGARDILVGSYCRYDPAPPTTTPPTLGFGEQPFTAISANNDDRPAAVGLANATSGANCTLPFVTVDTRVTPAIWLGDPAGGGIAVDERARVNVVGATTSTDYPVSLASQPPFLVGRNKVGPALNYDAVRTVFDMVQFDMARTDMTGSIAMLMGWNSNPPPPAFGGTTPHGALAAFGRQLGVPLAGNYLPRMQIAWEGMPPTAGNPGAFLVDRAPSDAMFGGTLINFGFPSTSPISDPVITGVEMWLVSSSATSVLWFPPVSGQSAMMRCPITALPPSGFTFTAQAVAMLNTPIIIGTTSHSFTASPALMFRY
ncbi:MAG: hypothetical protein FJ265_07215 [Planctomycetes bacterium]|nr:hypothetical protein [Planctomycetota bacterium]